MIVLFQSLIARNEMTGKAPGVEGNLKQVIGLPDQEILIQCVHQSEILMFRGVLQMAKIIS